MTDTAVQPKAASPVARIKAALANESTQEQFRNCLNENSGAFIASILDIYASDTNLQKCEPGAVIMECLKAATLKLPINKQLGLAYVIAYGGKPQFQMGYRGYIQLAMRTGQYRCINADAVPVGITVKRDLLSGRVVFEGEEDGEAAQGYFAHFELLNGFTKTLYMTAKEVESHAKRYSKSYSLAASTWKTDFRAMAIKTPLRLLLSKYGIMSTEMQQALVQDRDEEDMILVDIETHANSEPLVIEGRVVDRKTGEVTQEQQAETEPSGNGKRRVDPGF